MLVQRGMPAEDLARLADGGFAYAIIDACDNHELVLNKAYHELGESKAICLFKGTHMEDYDAVAPFLFSVDRALLDWISKHLDKTNWGVFAFTKATRADLCAHLQKFFMVLLPDGRKWFFCYYDPRILKTYLPTCLPAELQQFFGPVRGFAIFDPEQQRIIVFEHSAAASQQQSSPQASTLLTIRPEQFNSLAKLSKEHFVKQVAEHAQECFPELCSSLNEETLYGYIHYGIERAASHGICTERYVCQYIDLMFSFGADFDTNPAHRWAAEILNDDTIESSSEKLERLYEAMPDDPKGTAHAG